MYRVLVVDDEIAVGLFLQEHLLSSGYDVEIAVNAGEALGKIESDPPDLVLLDIRMPGTSGVELLATLQLREINVPVIMLTAVHEEELARQCLKMGARDYITKPINLHYLKDSILASIFTGGGADDEPPA